MVRSGCKPVAGLRGEESFRFSPSAAVGADHRAEDFRGQPGGLLVGGNSGGHPSLRHFFPPRSERTCPSFSGSRVKTTALALVSGGLSKLFAQKEINISATDTMLPWMRFFTALAMIFLVTRMIDTHWREKRVFVYLRRKLAAISWKGIHRSPSERDDPEMDRFQVTLNETKTEYRGMKTVELEVPVYAIRRVQVGFRGIKKEVPIHEIQQVQVGYKITTNQRNKTGNRLVIEQVPRYENRKIQVGTKTITKTVPLYEESKVQVGTKTVTRQIPEYRTEKNPN